MEEHIKAAQQPWMVVIGPMSAAYMLLQEMHWKMNLDAPGGKIYYQDKQGDQFEL